MRGPFPVTRLLVATLASMTAACASSPRAPDAGAGPPSACVVVPAAQEAQAATPGLRAAPPAALRVAVADPVSPSHAPAATNGSERLVFRQLYETLVEVDCEGRVRPGLAESWSREDGGLRWRFTLRPDARFWDGSPVTAHAVARAWATGAGAPGRPEGGAAVASAGVEGGGELTVVLTEPVTSAAAFARTSLAVTGGTTAEGWPLGTGRFHPGSAAEGAAGGLRLVAGSGAPVELALTFRSMPRGDARAALDAGADVLVSADPGVIAYARALADFTTVPLPWSGTYVVAAAAGRRATGEAAPSTPPADALVGLARGAVRADARPAQPPFWWTEGGCAPPDARSAEASGAALRAPPTRSRRTPSPRIVYPLGDAVARGIAERLVALAGRGSAVPSWLVEAVPGLRESPGAVVATGMEPDRIAGAARNGEALAFVVSVPRAPGGGCLSELLAGEDPVAGAVLAPEAGMRVTPLVDVHPSLVIRRGAASATVQGDGTLSFGPGGVEP